MSKRSTLLLLLLCIVLGVALRYYQLTARSLWFDESFSWRLIQFPWSEMIVRDAQDVHPPLYYIVLKGWSIVFGTSLLSLRSLSVTAAATTMASMYLFVSSAFKSRNSGLFAALLLAISGWQIQFAWEARMYTLGTTLALLASWALLTAIRREPQRLRWRLLYAVLGSLLAYVHYYALFTIAAHALFVVGYLVVATRGRIGELLQSRRLWYAGLALLLTALLYAPWLPNFLQQNRQVQNEYWILPIGGWSIPDTFYRMFVPIPGIPQHVGAGWIIIAIIPGLATLLLWFLLIRKRRYSDPAAPARWLVFLSGIVPFILSIIISFISQSLYQDRFFVLAHLFILIALADGLMNLPWVRLRHTAITVVIVGFIAAAVNFWAVLDIPGKPGAQAAAAYIFDQRTAGEPIIVSSPYVYFAILHYAQEKYHTSEPPRLYSETGTLAHFAGGPIIVSADIIGPNVFSANSAAIWVVDTTGFGSTRVTPPAPWQAQETQVYQEVFEYQGEVSVTKYAK
jgi:uncharacterized membrane protein